MLVFKRNFVIHFVIIIISIKIQFTIEVNEHHLNDIRTQRRAPPCHENEKKHLPTKSKAPWLVLIQSRNVASVLCEGALVTPKWVITGANCLLGQHEGDLRIVSHTKDDRQSVQIVFIYNGYDAKTHRNDLALLKVVNSFSISNYFYPICLQHPKDGFICESGCEVDSVSAVPNSMSMMDLENCRKMYEKIGLQDRVTNATVCVNSVDDSKDPECVGSPGSPLTCLNQRGDRILTGILSLGWRCASPASPAIFTKLSYFYEWISNTIEELSEDSLGDCMSHFGGNKFIQSYKEDDDGLHIDIYIPNKKAESGATLDGGAAGGSKGKDEAEYIGQDGTTDDEKNNDKGEDDPEIIGGDGGDRGQGNKDENNKSNLEQGSKIVKESGTNGDDEDPEQWGSWGGGKGNGKGKNEDEDPENWDYSSKKNGGDGSKDGGGSNKEGSEEDAEVFVKGEGENKGENQEDWETSKGSAKIKVEKNVKENPEYWGIWVREEEDERKDIDGNKNDELKKGSEDFFEGEIENRNKGPKKLYWRRSNKDEIEEFDGDVDDNEKSEPRKFFITGSQNNEGDFEDKNDFTSSKCKCGKKDENKDENKEEIGYIGEGNENFKLLKTLSEEIESQNEERGINSRGRIERGFEVDADFIDEDEVERKDEDKDKLKEKEKKYYYGDLKQYIVFLRKIGIENAGRGNARDFTDSVEMGEDSFGCEQDDDEDLVRCKVPVDKNYDEETEFVDSQTEGNNFKNPIKWIFFSNKNKEIDEREYYNEF